MNTNIRKMLAVLLALVCAISVLSGCAGKKTETPPETDVQTETDVTAAEPERYIYKHVAIVALDGAGTYFRKTDTPRLDEFFADGSVSYDCLTSNPSISAQCWCSLITGVTPEIHGYTNTNIYSDVHDPNSDFPTFFRIIREHRPDAVLASYSTWDVYNSNVIEEGYDIVKEYILEDDLLSQAAADYVREAKPTVLLTWLSECDEAGHTYEYGKKEHLAQITTEDGYIGRIIDAYEEAGILDDTLFIVTTDHGGLWKSHGGWLDEEKYIMYAVRGKTVIPHGTVEDIAIRDTAAIVLYALGLEEYLPEKSSAHIPKGLFEDCDGTERREITYTYDLAYRKHESEPTPEIGSGSSVVDALGADRMIAYFTFDRTHEDALARIPTEANGKLYYPLGFFGDGAEFDDGYITMDGFEPGIDSFSIGFWMKVMSNSQDPVIVGNQKHASGSNPGFALGFKYDWLDFKAGNKKTYTDNRGTLPEDYHDAWTYAVMVVDRENARIGFSFDFGEFEFSDLEEGFEDIDLTCKQKVNIGQDGSGVYPIKTPGIYDEMIFVDGVLTDDDIAALKSVYVHDDN